MEKNGRPTVMTNDTLAKLKEAFLLGCTDKEACLYAGDIHPSTLYKYQEENPDFTDQKERWKQYPILLARQTILRGIKTNPRLALAFLERKAKSEFSLRQELTGDEGRPLPIPILGTLTKGWEGPESA